eukprot:6173988-Alexandrium_andersonii.AAC.1
MRHRAQHPEARTGPVGEGLRVQRDERGAPGGKTPPDTERRAQHPEAWTRPVGERPVGPEGQERMAGGNPEAK